MKLGAAIAIAIVLAAAGCGSASADLFKVDRSGPGPGAALSLVVSDDGSVRCNGRAPIALDAERLLEARQLARDLEKQAALGLVLADGRESETTFRYRAELAAGPIGFADSSRGQPSTYTRLAAFTRLVARRTCGLLR